MLETADERTLVLVDEIGSGTEPSAGAALAIAMLERLLVVRRPRGRDDARDRVEAVRARRRCRDERERALRPADLRTDLPPGRRYPRAIARLCAWGVRAASTRRFVERAQSLLDSQERDYERALEDLALRNAELQAERDALGRERRAAEREMEELMRREAELDAQRERFSQHAEERMQQALRDFTSDLQRRAAIRDAQGRAARPRVSAAQSAQLTQRLEAMRRDLGIEPGASVAPGESGALETNDRVRVRSYGGEGTVLEDYGESVLVAFGSMKTVVSKREVERTGGGTPRTSASQTASLDAALRTSAELDVRGKRYAEAEPLVDRWIDEAALAGNTALRLIHGKGTGMLGRGLQEFLRGHPSVASVRYGNEEEGSHGVTMIELR